jgi:hypothetical protein
MNMQEGLASRDPTRQSSGRLTAAADFLSLFLNLNERNTQHIIFEDGKS